MCHGCATPLPTNATRYMLTIVTVGGGSDAAFCDATCRHRWATRRQRPAGKPAGKKAGKKAA